jgi:precorrin-6Y C5,15-methyltransferase (decarboxylating)
MKNKKLHIIGISPEGPGTLSPRSRRILRQAEQVYGGRRLLDMFPNLDCEKIAIANNLAQIAGQIQAARGARRIVVLASGDPGFFGIASFLQEKLGHAHMEVIPAVSAMQLAFARIGQSWEDAAFVSVHSRPIGDIVETVRSSPRVAILTDAKNTPAAVAAALMAAGIGNRPVRICQDLGSPREKVLSTTLAALRDKACSPLNIMIVLPPKNGSAGLPGPILGLPEDEFRQKAGSSLITKHEIRAVSLAKLSLTRHSVVWDIGAGSGAVSIEASLLAEKGAVYAIDDSPQALKIIAHNVKKFNRLNVNVIEASAPGGLDGLPDPDAVFIGGSRGRMPGIIELACRRLRPGGRVACNVVTLENVDRAARSLKSAGFNAEITQVSISRGKAAAGLTRLEPLNPVFIVTGSRSDK